MPGNKHRLALFHNPQDSHATVASNLLDKAALNVLFKTFVFVALRLTAQRLFLALELFFFKLQQQKTFARKRKLEISKIKLL